MPLYELKCQCGNAFSEFVPHHRPREIACPGCGKKDCEPNFAKLNIVTERRFAGSECESLIEGFHEDEVAEARQLFPKSDIRDDGSVHWSKRSDVRYFQKRRKEIREAEARNDAAR